MLARAKEYGRAFEVQGVLDDWMHILRPRRNAGAGAETQEPWLLRLLPEQHPGGCAGLADGARSQGLFDGGVASCEVHINKPDPRIYKALLDKYQLKAGESVFIDDRLENVQAALSSALSASG